jgi:hypothetical protein
MNTPPMPPEHSGSRLSVRTVIVLVVAFFALVGAAIAIPLAVIGNGGPAPTGTPATAPPSTFTLSGTLSFTNGDCSSAGYSDLASGAQVVVTSKSGELLSIGTLTDSASASSCDHAFAVNAVPRGLPFYGIAIGHRSVYWATGQEALGGVQLSIGGK